MRFQPYHVLREGSSGASVWLAQARVRKDGAGPTLKHDSVGPYCVAQRVENCTIAPYPATLPIPGTARP
jgi:hypothetical protein